MIFKRIIAAVMILTTVMTLSGCKYDSINNATTTELPSLPDYSEYIELGEYAGIEYTLLNDYTVDDKYIQYGIETLLYNAATFEDVTDRGAELGDFVTIRYTAFVDNKPLPNDSDTNGTGFFLGYSNFIDGFEDCCYGLKEGDTTTVKLTLPNDYNRINLRGKEVTFHVEILNLQKRTFPEITDELVAKNSAYSSVEEIRGAVTETIKINELYRRNAEIYNIVSKKVIENSVIKGYPEDLLNNLIDTNIENAKTQAALNGMAINDYLNDSYGVESLDEYRTIVTNNAKEFLELRMVMCEIARKENIMATLDEYNEYKIQYAKENGYMNIEDVNIYYSDEEILLDCSLAKIEDWLIGNSVEKTN